MSQQLRVVLGSLLLLFVAAPSVGQILPNQTWVLRNQLLTERYPLLVTVHGKEIANVEIVAIRRGQRFENAMVVELDDLRQVEKGSDTLHVFHVKAFKEASVNLQISATDSAKRPTQIIQVGTSTNSKFLFEKLKSGAVGRDRLVAVPDRFYPSRTNQIMFNLFCEEGVCFHISVRNENGKTVHSFDRWIHADKGTTKPIPFKKFQSCDPGTYQVYGRIKYSPPADCASLKPADDADYVLHWFFEVLR